MSERVPVVQVLPSGKEVVVASGYDYASAEKLLDWLTERHPNRDYYIDCARTVEEVMQGE